MREYLWLTEGSGVYMARDRKDGCYVSLEKVASLSESSVPCFSYPLVSLFKLVPHANGVTEFNDQHEKVAAGDVRAGDRVIAYGRSIGEWVQPATIAATFEVAHIASREPFRDLRAGFVLQSHQGYKITGGTARPLLPGGRLGDPVPVEGMKICGASNLVLLSLVAEHQ